MNSRSVEQDLPTLLFNHAFPWLEAPAPDADLADRYDRIMQLATGAEARAPRELDASGERLSATEGEDPLPIQTTGDRGDAQL